MSIQLTPDEALSRIPLLAGSTPHWQALPGGLTNRSFKVDTADGSFVLRLDSVHTAVAGVDRALELTVRGNACGVGLAAAVVHAEAGILLSEFLPGSVWQDSDLHHDDKLVKLAGLLRRVHQMPLASKPFFAERVAEKYIAAIVADSGLLGFAKECRALLRKIPTPERLRCCHNDVVAGNIIEHADLKLLDWEYACDNDPMFDLASVIGFHDFDAQQTDTLFSAYAGGANPAMYENLQGQICLFDIVQWLWFAARQCASPNPHIANRLNELRVRISCY